MALKTNENVRKSVKLEHPKIQIKLEKIKFCDTYANSQKTQYLRSFSGKKVKWRSTQMCKFHAVGFLLKIKIRICNILILSHFLDRCSVAGKQNIEIDEN